jgi:hypothetical protein
MTRALDVLDDAPSQVWLRDLNEELLQEKLQCKDLLTDLPDDLPLPVEGESKSITQQDGSNQRDGA